ncbi:hypothetical protein QOT17_015484 [Balamuthia mandrillaris]
MDGVVSLLQRWFAGRSELCKEEGHTHTWRSGAHTSADDYYAKDYREVVAGQERERRNSEILRTRMGRIGLSFLASFCSSCLVHVVVGKVLNRMYRTQQAKRGIALLPPLSLEDSYFLGEKAAAMAHGMLMGGLGGFYMILHKRRFSKETVFTYPKECDWLWAASVGFQVYDMVVMVLQRNKRATIWFHHTLVIIGCLFSFFYRIGTFYPAIFTFTELTLVTTNLSWYLDVFKLRGTPAYTVALILRVLAFYLFRSFIGPVAVWYGAYRGQLHQLFRMPRMATLLVLFNVLSLSCLNGYWTVALTRMSLRYLLPRYRFFEKNSHHTQQ